MEKLNALFGRLCWRWKRVNHRAGQIDQGTVALILDLAKAIERVSLSVEWAGATHFDFRRKILRVLCGYFVHQRRVQCDGCVAEPLQCISASLPGLEEKLLVLAHCAAGHIG